MSIEKVHVTKRYVFNWESQTGVLDPVLDLTFSMATFSVENAVWFEEAH